MAHVGVGIEGAVGGGHGATAHRPQALEHDPAVGPVPLHVAVRLGHGREPPLLLLLLRLLAFLGGRCALNMPFDFVLADYNDIAGTGSLIDEVGHELAGVIVEPVSVRRSGACGLWRGAH